ncbi:MAG: FtsX-like permease family protein [Chloroflexi bacterium]|nr:MAG: FtsX-like permease family protein [Chloroflexota bacterium]
MLQQLRFYYKHSLNDLAVNGRRTFFALLAIAAGVAAIVSLLTLGVMIDDTLTGSLQESNRGDIRISIRPFDEDPLSPEEEDAREQDGVVQEYGPFDELAIGQEGLETIQAWLDEHFPGVAELTYRQLVTGVAGTAVRIPAKDTVNPFTVPLIVETAKYPWYGDVVSEDGRPLDTLINAPTDIVISRNLADKLNAEVGDTLRLNSVNADFTIRGIVPTDVEGGFENIIGALIGFYYLDQQAMTFFDGGQVTADNIYLRLNDLSQLDAMDDALEERFPYLNITSTEDVRSQNEEVSDILTQLVSVMGLISLLIGGIGIINTMNVVVSRRRVEVAVLKTIGFEAEQITILFLVEAFIMGVLGSLLGIVLGWVLTFAIKGVAENFLAQSLTFRITPEPPLTGLIVGALITTIFGFLPTLSAGQVRPATVLHPAETPMPKAGRLRSFAAVIVVILALSLVAQPMIGGLLAAEDDGTNTTESVEPVETTPTSPDITMISASVGAVLGFLGGVAVLAGKMFTDWTHKRWPRRILRWLLFLVIMPTLTGLFGFFVPAVLFLLGAFITAGILYVLLWVVVIIIGRFFPSLGIVDLKIALRSILAARGRTASTLLALAVGIFTLSLISMLTTTILDEFERLIVEQSGGNVLIFASGDTLETVETTLANFDGVESFAVVGAHDVELLTVEDVSENQTITFDELRQRAIELDPGGAGPGYDDLLDFAFRAIDGREIDSNLPEFDFYAGRQLIPEDNGQPVMVMTANEATIALGFEVGDRLTFRFVDSDNPETNTLTFEVVGMKDGRGIDLNTGSPNYVPLDSLPPELEPGQLSAVVQVDEARLRDLQRTFNEIPGTFLLETRLLNDLINRLVTQFTAFPILVSALALFTGGVVIANSVALTTMERRREIAIMKAVGLQRERVLSMLLLENGIMGIIGGLTGVGIGALMLFLMLTQLFDSAIGDSIPFATAFLLMGLALLITLIASVLTVWGASGEKPLNVLRYD